MCSTLLALFYLVCLQSSFCVLFIVFLYMFFCVCIVFHFVHCSLCFNTFIVMELLFNTQYSFSLSKCNSNVPNKRLTTQSWSFRRTVWRFPFPSVRFVEMSHGDAVDTYLQSSSNCLNQEPFNNIKRPS